MTQAVDASQDSALLAKGRNRIGTAQVPGAGFGPLLALAQHPAGGLGPGPETIGRRARSEANDPGRADLDDIAAEELQSPSDKPEHLKARATDKAAIRRPMPPNREPVTQTHPPGPERPVQAPASDSAAESKNPENQRTGSGPVSGRSDRSGKPRTTAPANQAAAAAVRLPGSGGQSASVPTMTGNVRSMGALVGGQATGKDLLARLTNRQKPPILRATREELPAQVSRALARVVSEGGGRLVLRLNPNALGEVRIEVDMRHGVARATLNTQTDAARELLHSELDTLRTALERRGVSVERLEVAGPTTDGSATGFEAGARGGGDHPAAPDGSNGRGGSAGPWNGSSEHDPSGGLRAERGAEAMAGTPVRTDADGVVRVDAIA